MRTEARPLRIGAKGKLQNRHPRKIRSVCRIASTSGVITPRFSATIGSSPNSSCQRLEQLHSRTLDPGAVHRRRLARRNLEVRLEAAEVVDAHHVEEPQHAAHPRHPPPEALRPQPLPAIDRIAPQLPGRAEVIRRNALRPSRGLPRSSSQKNCGAVHTSALSCAT